MRARSTVWEPLGSRLGFSSINKVQEIIFISITAIANLFSCHFFHVIFLSLYSKHQFLSLSPPTFTLFSSLLFLPICIFFLLFLSSLYFLAPSSIFFLLFLPSFFYTFPSITPTPPRTISFLLCYRYFQPPIFFRLIRHFGRLRRTRKILSGSCSPSFKVVLPGPAYLRQRAWVGGA